MNTEQGENSKRELAKAATIFLTAVVAALLILSIATSFQNPTYWWSSGILLVIFIPLAVLTRRLPMTR